MLNDPNLYAQKSGDILEKIIRYHADLIRQDVDLRIKKQLLLELSVAKKYLV